MVNLFEHGPSDPALPDKGNLLRRSVTLVRMPRSRTLVRPTVKFRGYPASIPFYMVIRRHYLRTASALWAHKVYVESGGDFVVSTPRSAGT